MDAAKIPAPNSNGNAAGGMRRCSDVELLEALVGPDQANDSARALELAMALLSSASAPLVDAGLTPPDVERLLAAVEVGRRIERGVVRPPPPPKDGKQDVLAFLHGKLRGLDHEEVWAVLLDKRDDLLGVVRIARGNRSRAEVDVRPIVACACTLVAAGVVLVHNHPSGGVEPSAGDIATTDALARALAALGLRLLDHVIVATGGFTSLAERGCLADPSLRFLADDQPF